jgi:hypothetical protein
MMKNIAVIIRGHFRTWDYNHKTAFKFFESIADNVEYYFVTWQLENFATDRITNTFYDNNQNLIKLLTVYPESAYYTSWQGPSWLNHAIMPYKKQRERYITYDAVFDTRPDIIYIRNNKSMLPPSPNTWYVTAYESSFGNDGVTRHIAIEDHFFMSTSEVHDIMNTRHVYKDEIGMQAQQLKLATELGVHTAAMDWVEASIVRPTTFESIPNPDDYFTTDYRKIQRDWMYLSVEQKLAILKKHNIRKEDYTTASVLAKI